MSAKKTTKKMTKKNESTLREFFDSARAGIVPDEDPLGWAKLVCQHRPRPHDDDLAEDVRNAAIVLIVNILQNCKNTPDRTTAVRRVREALMYAESAIELEWEEMA